MDTRTTDLRSDTVTLPTRAMLDAMGKAELGDDGYGEDATVNYLEKMAADIVAHEAALFVPSGTMGNLISLLVYCNRGDEVIMGNLSHILLWEFANASALGGIQVRSIPNNSHGQMNLNDIEAAIRIESYPPRTGLICLENTHNRCGGTVISAEEIRGIAEVGHRYKIPIHLDGSRIFNAALAAKKSVSEMTSTVDSVMFCFSKGLSAPVGSIICGTHDFIGRARNMRMVLGGQMRQIGVLAAAAIVALETMRDQLIEDHENARLLAEGIAEINEFTIDLTLVQTNIVLFGMRNKSHNIRQIVEALAIEGIKVLAIDKNILRAVTHRGINTDDIRYTIAALRKISKSF